MEELDLDQLEQVAGGRGGFPQGGLSKCSECGKEIGKEADAFGVGLVSVFDSRGERRLCSSCYEKWCAISSNTF